MTQEQLNERHESEQKKTVSLEVPTHDIDEFDLAIEKERERTRKAMAAAEHNRKKYGDAKDIIGEKESRIAELEDALERKNTEIARLRRADRGAREVNIVENRGERQMLDFIADKMKSTRA